MAASARIVVESHSDVGSARQKGRVVAESLGFGHADLSRIATAISEIARNIVEHAKRGEVHICEINKAGKVGIQIVAEDHGPGIASVEAAMQDGYTTKRSSLGIGLPSAQRLMDEFEVHSEIGKGTTVVMTKWLRAR
ncbi:MAG: anti-sigma regulatory factor [Deltaproteobacteria bacterium]|nr:anti-sigma regulatory factor [Deltaproteobacteria bacterium]